jgi:hypothetical protein
MSDPYRDNKHLATRSSDDGDTRYDDSDSEVVQLFLKTPTPLASPEAAVVQNFVQKQRNQATAQQQHQHQLQLSQQSNNAFAAKEESTPVERKSCKRKATSRKRKKGAAKSTVT